jgi:hypothetical protein
LIEAISELRKTVLAGIPQMRDVIGMSTISNLSPTNAGALFNGDKAEEINAFIDAQRGAEGDVGALQAALEEAKESTSEIQTTIAGVITAKMEIAASVGDPWLKARHAEKADATPKIPKLDSKDDQNWCSFGRIASLFIAAPLLESKKFDEIQMIFYTFNDKSSHMYNQNIACFPIDLNGNTGLPKLFEAWQKEKIQVSVSSFMGFVNQYYLSNMAAKGYGFSNIFTRDEDGKAVISLKDDEINELQSKKDAVLKDAYGAEADLVFKLPRIRMIPEAVPHIKPAAPGDEFKETETILRLHFFDDAACKYTGLHDILSSQRNSEMGVVRQQAVAASAIEGAEDSHWEKIATDIKNAMPEGFLQETAAGSGYYYVAGGSPALKHFIKSNMPSITYGTENSALKNISMSSMHNSSDTTIHMIRAQRAGNSDSATPGEQDRGLPIRIMPMQASGESIGCPILNHGQQFFIDMGTGTTADNVYAVCGLDHTLEPGNFMTKFKLIPIDAYGKYESMLDSVDKALAICAASPPPPPPTNE